MALHCNKIIITSIKLAEPTCLEYLQEFKNLLEAAHPGSINERIKLVSEENFVPEVLSDPQSTNKSTKMWESATRKLEWSKVQCSTGKKVSEQQ